ncbi:MAG: DUF4147 domain-containing protein [Pirellulales bacterium]|nr:DUF4147 domain-containing protein [Pirellulales bacterium]
MNRPADKLRQDALRIWSAGLRAVRSARLIFQAVEVDGRWLRLGDDLLDLGTIDRIIVVGGGKAAAGMTLALEQALGPALLRDKRVCGLVNVPADCLLATDAVALSAGRPAAINEPTSAGVASAREMLRQAGKLGQHDLCIALISGGGSALLPAPVDGITLAEKRELTRAMAAAGATIDQLNTVRRELSLIKGGGLARACRARRLIGLVLSDVLGDDLSLIASGPTVLRRPTPDAAADALQSLGLGDHPAAAPAIRLLGRRLQCSREPFAGTAYPGHDGFTKNEYGCQITNVLIGNNAMAVDAAGVEAERLGYSHAMVSANASEGAAEAVGRRLVEMAQRMRVDEGPDCLISGGEPTVRLAPPTIRGRGGRNQQLCLAALGQMADWRGVALVAGGTDGEDGPTDAAGACVDESVAAAGARLGLADNGYLDRNDAYSFFEKAGGLLITGPTHTNVCDLRVVTVSRGHLESR